MISKSPNLIDSEDDSIPTLDRWVCNFWISLISSRRHLKLSTTTTSSERNNPNFTTPIPSSERNNPNFTTPIPFPCVCKFWKSIHKFVGKHFNTRSDPSSTNPNIIIDSLPTLPFDLITEILSRLPVKALFQFRAVCKSWNSLISNDPNFAKKQLTNSTTHSIYSLGFSYPGFSSIYPPDSANCKWRMEIVGSCNGILCLAYKEFILLWNPSITKIKELPLLPKPHYPIMRYAFGYDSVNDHYKVVVVSWSNRFIEVKVNTLGTGIWKNIDKFPFGAVPDKKSGKYVSGTINWLVSSQRWSTPPYLIVSLDLANESYQEVLQPDYGEVNVNSFLTLDVFRDCLCIISGHDIWLMKEYGKKESWIKLFTISYKQDPSMSYSLIKVVYVFEDDQVLLQCKMPCVPSQLIVYDPRIATFKFVTFQNSFNNDINVSKVWCPRSMH